MNNLKFLSSAIALLFATIIPLTDLKAERVVIVHTNDTHSQIDPNEKDLGGIGRRKVLIDSIRRAEKNVMLVDAGDMVQGTLYFSLFGGEVESKMMNKLGYDLQILGNHEFDNGMEALSNMYKNLNATKLSSNYKVDKSTLAGLLEPYAIRQFGDKKIGFIAINLIPKGMIADKNSVGVEYLDGLKAANSYAWILKNMEGCDAVVALTHVGYENEPGISDVDLARGSENIDVIIGGHSHTLINPAEANSKAWRVANAVGDSVLIAQTGKSGLYIGEVDIDFGTNGISTESKLIKVDNRLDSKVDPEIIATLAPYRAKVDSVMNIKIGKAAATIGRGDKALLNLMSDVVRERGRQLLGKQPDLAIINKGGLRTDLQKGEVTKGEIMQIMPFDNTVVVLEINGKALLEAMDVMASRGGDAVSGNVAVTYNPTTGKCVAVTIDGKPVVPAKTYTLATINYLADGGDYMTPLKEGNRVAESENVLYDDVIAEFTDGILKGKTLRPDTKQRWSVIR